METVITSLLFCPCVMFVSASSTAINESIPELKNDGVIFIPDDEGRPYLVDLNSRGPDIFVNGDQDISFLLYTKRNPTNPIRLRLGDSRALVHLDVNQETKFLIHGWNSKGQSMYRVKQEYVQLNEENVVVVDWSGPASSLYTSSLRATRLVGAYLARFLDFLSAAGVSLSMVHLVGHSLGAHVAGIAGQRVTAARVGKITGLDPAAPGYGRQSLENRLDASDAIYVQVIHTNAGKLGWASPMGHIDFYPNGGRRQPGCGIDLVGTCSHSRAHVFFAESVNSPVGFWGVECTSWSEYQKGRCRDHRTRALMGSKTDRRFQGSFYLSTERSSPFAKGYY